MPAPAVAVAHGGGDKKPLLAPGADGDDDGEQHGDGYGQPSDRHV